MIWFIIAAGAALLLIIAFLIMGTVMLFNQGIVSDNYRKGPKPAVAWEEDEDHPEDVVFNPNCIPYKDEMIAVRKWVKSHELKGYTVTSFDGLKLTAKFLPAENMRGIVLMMHGYRSNPLHDFSLAIKEYYEMGIGCFLPYQRAHGDSEGKYICFGVNERFDVLKWCELIGEEYPGMPIILDGISMGASTVLMASGLELPDTVKGIVADCGFTSPFDIFSYVVSSRFKIPPFPFVYTAGILVKLIAHFPLRKVSTVKELKKNTLPIFFAHGQEDGFVPHEMTVKNYETAKETCECTFLSVPGATHGMSFMIDRPHYIEEVKKLVEKCVE